MYTADSVSIVCSAEEPEPDPKEAEVRDGDVKAEATGFGFAEVLARRGRVAAALASLFGPAAQSSVALARSPRRARLQVASGLRSAHMHVATAEAAMSPSCAFDT